MKDRAHAVPAGGSRFYRSRQRAVEWVGFEVKYRETDLWIRAGRRLEKEAMDAVLDCRHQLENYISQNPQFLTSLTPLPDDPTAPLLVRCMLDAAARAGVGPMASVAGAIAQRVGQTLKPLTESIIVENGGDCYLDVDEDIRVGVYAGPKSPFHDRLALKFPKERFPLGVCTSSGTIGHSLSFGKADAVVVVSRNAALADAAATALGNMVRAPSDIETALERAAQIPDVDGALVLIGDKMGARGALELTPL
jgi:ApbE superfamily uncharacterized protein (UPF0280 family)